LARFFAGWGRPARAHAAREPPKENRRCVRRSRERPASMMPRGAARRGAAHALARLHDPARTPHTTASVLVCMCAGRQARLTQVGSGRALRQGSQPASTMPRGAAPRTRSPARARQPAVEEMHEPYQLCDSHPPLCSGTCIAHQGRLGGSGARVHQLWRVVGARDDARGCERGARHGRARACVPGSLCASAYQQDVTCGRRQTATRFRISDGPASVTQNFLKGKIVLILR
jgi:hypothetical protein